MVNVWHDVNAKYISPDNFLAVIEIPQGSKKKYELEKETGLLRLDRILYTSTHYPANYGFIPRTYADDEDPLDVLVLCSESLDPLVMVHCYPIGVIRMVDENKHDDKIVAIPFKDPTWMFYKDIIDLPPHTSDEIVHFFEVYKQLEHKTTSPSEVLGSDKAREIVQEAIETYKRHYCGKIR